jgi:hypothetical protein
MFKLTIVKGVVISFVLLVAVFKLKQRSVVYI